MLGKFRLFLTYFSNVIIISLISFCLMNPIGGFFAYSIAPERSIGSGEFTISGIRYVSAMVVVNFIVQATAVLIASVGARSIVDNTKAYMAAMFMIVAWIFSYLSYFGSYGIDIQFTNPDISHFAISMAPLLAFSLVTSLFMRRSLIPLPQSQFSRFLLLIACTAYIIAIFTIFAMIVLQPEWSPSFRFYSEFDNQGRGG